MQRSKGSIAATAVSAGLALLALVALPISLLVMVRATLMFGGVSTAILCHPCTHPEHQELRTGFMTAARQSSITGAK